jgi:hypothetical protein
LALIMQPLIQWTVVYIWIFLMVEMWAEGSAPHDAIDEAAAHRHMSKPSPKA